MYRICEILKNNIKKCNEYLNQFAFEAQEKILYSIAKSTPYKTYHVKDVIEIFSVKFGEASQCILKNMLEKLNFNFKILFTIKTNTRPITVLLESIIVLLSYL